MALKGIGHGGEGPLAALQRTLLKPQWGYGWSAECPGDPAEFGPAGFTPMVWGGGEVEKRLAVILKELDRTGANTILGFNEPDLAKSSYKQQSNMTVTKALRLWPLLQSTGLRLGSPATIKWNAPWLGSFMSKADKAGYDVDFMTMHCYGHPKADDFLDKIASLYKRYQRPIWVTEFAVADWDAKKTGRFKYRSEEVRRFMREAIAGMNEMPYVERYAWKTREHGDLTMGTSALFHSDGKTLTPTGELYASL